MRLPLAILAFLTMALAQSPADSAARLPLEAYLRGHATANPTEMDRAFHPSARIQGLRLDGNFADWSLSDYKRGFTGTPAPDESQRKRSIDFLEVRGNTAIARVTLDYPTAVFTDYFLLMSLNGEWRIMNKIFHVQRK